MVGMMESPEMAAWTLWMQARGYKPGTILVRQRRVTDFADTVGTDPATAAADDVIRYFAALAVGPSTRATYYSHLRSWFGWLVRMGYRIDNPCDKMPPPRVPRRRPRPVTDEQLAAILAVRMRRRTRMMILLAAFQGLRVHEIAKVRGEDVDLLAGQLRIVGKGGVDALLPLHPIVVQAMLDDPVGNFPRKGYWFSTYVGNVDRREGPILARSVSNLLSDVMERAGVLGGPHRLRHTYGTRLVRNGANIRVVQELLRHASLQTTQIYTGVTDDQMRTALETLAMPVGGRELVSG